MRKIVLIALLTIFLFSCSSDKKFISAPRYSKIKMDTLLAEKISCRALAIDGNKVWYSANQGKYGYISLVDSTDFSAVVAKENLKLEFRSIAQTSQSIFILSVANPALLYKIDKETKQIVLVYQENTEKVFYDSMLFMNNQEGIAIGDPTSVCPSIITTNDGGTTWKKRSCDTLPNFADGEAFFAASNTNLVYKNNTLIMVSGGKKSRAFTSKDKGENWQIFETPIVQGNVMTGIFTADFYDENTGFIAGGNYEKPFQNFQNKAFTTNGGKTWALVAENEGFGYASCVQYLPYSAGKAILEVGANGVFYSRDGGKKWKQLAPDKDFIAFRFVDNKTLVASGKDRIVKIVLK